MAQASQHGSSFEAALSSASEQQTPRSNAASTSAQANNSTNPKSSVADAQQKPQPPANQQQEQTNDNSPASTSSANSAQSSNTAPSPSKSSTSAKAGDDATTSETKPHSASSALNGDPSVPQPAIVQPDLAGLQIATATTAADALPTSTLQSDPLKTGQQVGGTGTTAIAEASDTKAGQGQPVTNASAQEFSGAIAAAKKLSAEQASAVTQSSAPVGQNQSDKSSDSGSDGSSTNSSPAANAHTTLANTDHSATAQKPLLPSITPDATLNGQNQAATATTTTSNTATQNAANVALQSATEMPSPQLTSPSSGSAQNHQVGNASSSNGAPNQSTDASSTKISADTTTADAAKNKTSDNSGSSSDGSSQGSQNGSQSTQHSQSNSPAYNSVVSKIADGASVQTQPVATQSDSRATTTHSASQSANDASRPDDLRGGQLQNASDSGEVVTGSGINTARVIQAMNSTEMHVGMHSTEFGDISIRTLVNQQQMVAQISLDHGDLSRAIAAHVSTVQAKLGNEYGLNASIEVSHQGASFSSGESGQSSARDQRSYNGSVRAISMQSEPEAIVNPTAVVESNAGYRLDIRA
jgi:hypothetical protein